MAVFYLDFSKAFEIVCHYILVSELGCCGQVNKWVDDQAQTGVLSRL